MITSGAVPALLSAHAGVSHPPRAASGYVCPAGLAAAVTSLP